MKKKLLEIKKRLDEAEETRLSRWACPSNRAVRRRPDKTADNDHRQNFAVDADRVLHSMAYSRYIDKTQVFSLIKNDHITHRVLHVQLVGKIARSIGRMLGLNEDLIEAIALAHDIGHPPFGHDGEKFLGAKCLEHGLPAFQHALQSVRFLEKVEKKGRGLNLSLQVLDGVFCHDGEADKMNLEPAWDRDFAALDREIEAKARDHRHPTVPMTLEGCVVRLSDTISYIGRDFEDAVRLGLVRHEDLPELPARVLGESNGTMVYRMVVDLTENSLGKDSVCFSPKINEALLSLKRFNYENIYLNEKIKTEHSKIEQAFSRLFDTYLDDIKNDRKQSPIIKDYLANMDSSYREKNQPAVLVRDFIAGMTDDYFLSHYGEVIWPSRLPSRFD